MIIVKEGLNNTNPMVIKRGDPFVQVLFKSLKTADITQVVHRFIEYQGPLRNKNHP